MREHLGNVCVERMPARIHHVARSTPSPGSGNGGEHCPGRQVEVGPVTFECDCKPTRSAHAARTTAGLPELPDRLSCLKLWRGQLAAQRWPDRHLIAYVDSEIAKL